LPAGDGPLGLTRSGRADCCEVTGRASGGVVEAQGGLDFANERTAVPGSAIAPALALEGPPGADVMVRWRRWLIEASF
jgi:hypothetical protein